MKRILLSLTLLLFVARPAIAQTAISYEDLTIEALRKRSYGAGEFRVEQTLATNTSFTRSLVSFDSDGLKVYGFMNMPRASAGASNKKFPVVLVLHGYVNPRTYRTPYTYTQRYADALARAGFLVIHPDYRGHGKSEGNETLFRTGYAIDILNLIEHVKKLPNANPNAIGLFGHSMGGGISLRVLTISKDIKASVVYGSMNSDDLQNRDRIRNVFRGALHIPEDDVPDIWLPKISPSTYMSDVNAAISIHHGARDAIVPLGWSKSLNDQLSTLDKEVEYFVYPNQGHSLQGPALTTMLERVIRFYRKSLTG
jgi:dipeptidyl aminopeptidase/acylaminoacyl peptidase